MLDRIKERAAEGRREADDGWSFAAAMLIGFALIMVVLGAL